MDLFRAMGLNHHRMMLQNVKKRVGIEENMLTSVRHIIADRSLPALARDTPSLLHSTFHTSSEWTRKIFAVMQGKACWRSSSKGESEGVLWSTYGCCWGRV